MPSSVEEFSCHVRNGGAPRFLKKIRKNPPHGFRKFKAVLKFKRLPSLKRQNGKIPPGFKIQEVKIPTAFSFDKFIKRFKKKDVKNSPAFKKEEVKGPSDFEKQIGKCPPPGFEKYFQKNHSGFVKHLPSIKAFIENQAVKNPPSGFEGLGAEVEKLESKKGNFFKILMPILKKKQTLFVFQVVAICRVVANSIEEAWSRGGGERGDKHGGVCLFVLCVRDAGAIIRNSDLGHDTFLAQSSSSAWSHSND